MARGSAHRLFELEKWWVEPLRSAFPGHLSGWLTSKATGNRYVFSVVNGAVQYMREPRRPTNIPTSLDLEILKIRDHLLEQAPC